MHFVRLSFLLLLTGLLNSGFLSGETIRIEAVKNVAPVIVDVPTDWIKNQLVKNNGIIYTLKQGSSEIEIRSFVVSAAEMDMDYLINAKAARMYGKYSYINILLEKEENAENLKKKTIFWKIRYQNKTLYEKTIILQRLDSIVILSCLAPEDEYQHKRVIFENAILSLKYDLEKPSNSEKEPEPEPEPKQEQEPVSEPEKKSEQTPEKESKDIPADKPEGESAKPEKSEKPEAPEKKTDADSVKPDSSQKQEMADKILKDLQEKDTGENAINKSDKIKKKVDPK